MSSFPPEQVSLRVFALDQFPVLFCCLAALDSRVCLSRLLCNEMGISFGLGLNTFSALNRNRHHVNKNLNHTHIHTQSSGRGRDKVWQININGSSRNVSQPQAGMTSFAIN